MHPFYLWYHSQDWINEGPTVEGLTMEDRKWPRPEPKYALPPLEPKRVRKTTQPTPKAEAKRHARNTEVLSRSRASLRSAADASSCCPWSISER